MKRFINWKLALILIFILAAFLRLWQLGNVPAGIPDDEAAYIYNAYSIWHTGKDILGNFLPLSFNAHSSMSPVPVYLTAPFVGIMEVSAFSGRLPAALASLGSVLILFLITASLFRDKKIALFSSLLLAVSPWALQIGRGAILDTDFAMFFLLLGIYVFLKHINTKKFLWSLIPFTVAFYSYHATKVFFVFLIIILVFFFRQQLLKRKKEAALFLLGCLLILVSFLIVIKTQTVTRQENVSLLNDPKAAIQVNWERDKNGAPWTLRTIFNNKPLYYLRIIRENYLKAFSTEFLFISGGAGNSIQIVNIFFRGEFYIIELPLLLLGIYVLLKEKEKFNRNFLLLWLLISPLPSTFTIDTNFVDRDIMMLPVLLIIIALGLNHLVKVMWQYKAIYKYAFLIIFTFIYLFLVSGYLYQYYFRWSVYGAEGWGKSYKDLVYLLNSKQNTYKNIYVGGKSLEFLLQYAIFDKVDPKLIQKVWYERPIRLYNITMFTACLNKNDSGYITKFLPKNTLYAASFENCLYKDAPAEKIVDYGEPLHVIWNIYENN